MPDTLISLNNLTKIYDSNATASVAALNGVTFDIYQGEFVSITGASGSGKSTLLNLIGLLDSPSDGELIINKKNTQQLNEREKEYFRLQTISFVFQFFNLIENFTALENISFQLELQGKSRSVAVEKSMEILRYLQLEDRAHLYPPMLSGGEQQRIAIGRALVKDSLFILADEPTAHLDSKNAQLIMDLLRQINVKFQRTIVLVTHEPHQAEQTDRQIILQDGKVQEIRHPSQNKEVGYNER